MAADKYALWRLELKTPTPAEDRQQRDTRAAFICGFWRIDSARTKPDYPVAIFPQDDRIIIKIGVGAKDGQSLFSDADTVRFDDFIASTWLKCDAVTESAYHAAMDSGRWADEKPARFIGEQEKLGLEPATPPDRGGNMPPEEAEADLDQQIITKIEEQLAKIPDVKFPLNKDSATFAASIVEKLRGLGKQGEPRRKSAKQPHLDAAAAVDAHWFVLKTGSDAIQYLVNGIAAFTRAEEARLRREQEEAAKVERERIAKETADRIQREQEEAAQQALARGEAFEEPTEEAIAEQVAAEVEQQIAEQPAPEAPKVVVRGSEHSRSITKATQRTARITDLAKLAAHFAATKDADFTEYLQKRANAAARARLILPGTEPNE